MRVSGAGGIERAVRLSLLALLAACDNVPASWPGVTPMDKNMLCPRDPLAQDRTQLPSKPAQASIERIVEGHEAELLSCYEELINRVSLVEGSVDVEFEIQPAGTVGRACAWETDLTDQKFMSCVLGQFKALRFDPAPQASAVRWPLVFRSNRDANCKLSNNDERLFW